MGNREAIVQLGGMFNDLFIGVATEAKRSIQTGSELTGAPGQPVGQYGPGYHPGEVGGTLRDSWELGFPDADTATISTNIVYAEGIEDLIGPHGPITIRSSVGGGHSVALTVAGLPNIVESEKRRIFGSGR